MSHRTLHISRRFEKDMKLAQRRGKALRKLREVIDQLLSNQPLALALHDHPLKGNFKGYRDLHIEPDWLLIYKQDKDNVWLIRTGSHADIFGK